MSRTIAERVRYKSLYISLSSSAQQQREMIITSSAFFGERVFLFGIERNAGAAYLA